MSVMYIYDQNVIVMQYAYHMLLSHKCMKESSA
jgi:hypothetical protein